MRSLKGGFSHKTILGLAAGAWALAASIVVSNAASIRPQNTEPLAVSLQAFFTPKQFDPDGFVYGVHARGNGGDLPSLQIMPGSKTRSTSLTPDPCPDVGVGWCMTPHSIAASKFGWDFHAGGAGAVIGIVDGGIDLNNPEFTGRILPGHCVVSSANDCVSANDQMGGDLAISPTGGDTHGTHVAGIAAGTNTGLAYAASILPVKVCSSSGLGCGGVNDGILWAAQHGASIINVSIGGATITPSDVSSLQQSVAAGALLVVAGGNGGPKYPSGGYLSGAALQDGIRGSMIVVGSTGAGGTNGQGKISSFSQTPGTRCEVHSGQAFCMRDYFVVAPGSDIWSSTGNGAAADPSYGYLSGTSMATPYVSGVAALIKGSWPYLSSNQIANVIFNTTDDLGAPGTDPVYGRGAVDVTKAMNPAIIPVQPNARVAPTTYMSSGGVIPTVQGNLAGGTQATGATNAMASIASGPLATAIVRSSTLKNAVMIDSFGRNFSVNLTKAADVRGFDPSYSLMANQYTDFMPFAFGVDSPVGPLFASGYATDTVTPAATSGMFRGASDYHNYDLRDFTLGVTVIPGIDLNLGYHLDMGGAFNNYDASASIAYDGLFMSASAVNSPYASLANGGSFIGSTIALADDLHLRFGEISLSPEREPFYVNSYSMVDQLTGPRSLYDLRAARGTMAGVSWDFAHWGGVGVTATQIDEQNGLLGGYGSGALSIADGANTTALGVSARIGFGDGWVTTASYSEGITQLDLKPSSIFSSATDLHSRAYGIAVAKHGLFGEDSLGFAVTRPIQIYSGSAEITAADGVDSNDNLILNRERISLAGIKPETDIELGYITTFLDGALALQANAAYQLNTQGQNGTNSLAVVSRAKIKF